MQNFSYVSNITYHTRPLMGALIGASRGKRMGIGTGKGALLGLAVGTIPGAIYGTAKEAIGRHKLKKAGYKLDKHGNVEVVDKDGNVHKVHMNSMHTHAGNSTLKSKGLKNPIVRHFLRQQGLDVPIGYKEDSIVNVDPWVVKYDKDKTKALQLHELGHKVDKRLDTDEGRKAYAKDTKPFEEYADKFAVDNGVKKETLKAAVHDAMDRLDSPWRKLTKSREEREKDYDRLDQGYRGDFLYKKLLRKKRVSKKAKKLADKKKKEVEEKKDAKN